MTSENVRAPDLPKSLNDSFEVFIGIDQTGAVANKSGTVAKPLFPVIIHKENQRYSIHLRDLGSQPLRLDSFDRDALNRLLASAGLPSRLDARVAIMIDCVFGLPFHIWPRSLELGLSGLWQLFRIAARDTQVRQGFGLKPAARFFDDLLSASQTKDAEFPTRLCERLAKANSVFRTHPYQKNIQCGTYRVWRDLGHSHEPWANVRFFTPSKEARFNRPWIFESYPSLFWRELLSLGTRSLDRLPQAMLARLEELDPKFEISDEDWSLMQRSPDRADAAVLALGGAILSKRGHLFERAPSRRKRLQREGWIIGLDQALENPDESWRTLSSREFS